MHKTARLHPTPHGKKPAHGHVITPHRAGYHPSHVHTMLELQQSIGNRAVQRLVKQRLVQHPAPAGVTAPRIQLTRVMVDRDTSQYSILGDDAPVPPGNIIVYNLDTEALFRLEKIANRDDAPQDVRVAALTAIQDRMKTNNQFGDDEQNTRAMETLKQYRTLMGQAPRQKNYEQWEINRTEQDAQQEETQGLARVNTVLAAAKKSKDSLKRKTAKFFLAHPDRWGVLVLHPIRRAKHPRRYFIRCLGNGQRATVDESAYVGGFFDPNIHAILLRTHARSTGQLMTNAQILGVMAHELGHMFSEEMRSARDKNAAKTKLDTGYKLYKDEFRSYWMEAETGSGPGAGLAGQNRVDAIKTHILQHYPLVSAAYNGDNAIKIKIDAITTPYLSFNLINSERIVKFYTMLFDRGGTSLKDVKKAYGTLTKTEKKHMKASPKFVKLANNSGYTPKVIVGVQPYLKRVFKI